MCVDLLRPSMELWRPLRVHQTWASTFLWAPSPQIQAIPTAAVPVIITRMAVMPIVRKKEKRSLNPHPWRRTVTAQLTWKTQPAQDIHAETAIPSSVQERPLWFMWGANMARWIFASGNRFETEIKTNLLYAHSPSQKYIQATLVHIHPQKRILNEMLLKGFLHLTHFHTHLADLEKAPMSTVRQVFQLLPQPLPSQPSQTQGVEEGLHLPVSTHTLICQG